MNALRLLASRCSRREFLLLTAGFIVACKSSSAGTSTSATAPAAAEATQAPPPAPTTAEPTPTPSPQPSPTAEPTTIEVRGDDSFKAWTEQALTLLQTRAPEIYARIITAVRVIESVDAGSGMYVEEKRYAVGDQTAYAPGYNEAQQLIWFAGTIAHDAHHSELFSRNEPHTGKDAEIACLAVQKQALELLTDDPFFANYVQGLIDGADDPANQYWNQPNRHW